MQTASGWVLSSLVSETRCRCRRRGRLRNGSPERRREWQGAHHVKFKLRCNPFSVQSHFYCSDLLAHHSPQCPHLAAAYGNIDTHPHNHGLTASIRHPQQSISASISPLPVAEPIRVESQLCRAAPSPTPPSSVGRRSHSCRQPRSQPSGSRRE